MWRLSDEQLRSVLAHLPAVLYQDSHEPVPQTLYLSPNAETVLGSEADEHLRDPDLWWRSIDPADHDHLMEVWTQAYVSEQPYTLDYRYHRPDGVVVWLREHATPVRDGDGRITHWQGVLLDVTTQRATLDELAASEERYRSLTEQLPVVVYVDSTGDGRGPYVSPNVEAMLGYPASAFVRGGGWLWNRLLHPDDADRVLPYWKGAWFEGVPYRDLEYRLIHADGHDVWVRDRAYIRRAEDDSLEWRGVLLDITAERRAADELAESEGRFRTLVEHLPAAVYTLTNDDLPRLVYASERIEDLYGYPAERWVERDDLWPDVVHPDDRAEVLTAWSEARERETPFERTYRILHADGSHRWISDRLHPVRDRAGRILSWEGLSFDVTREHETSVALREGQERHERLLQQIPGVAFSMLPGPRREFDYLSPRIQDILGYPRSHWFEEDGWWLEVIHPDDRDAVTSEWDRCAQEGAPFRVEYRSLHADGHVVWLRAETLPIRGSDGEIERWQGLWLDITETKQAREEQARTEARYQRLLEQTPAIVFTTDHLGAVQYIGPQVEQILGLSTHLWEDDPLLWERLLHPDDHDRVLDGWTQASLAGRPYEADYRLRRADGSYRWVREHTHPVHDADGTIATWQGLTIDVHDLHAAEEAQHAAEARARVLLENVPAVVYEMGPDDERRTLFVSPHIERLLGYSREEWLDQPDIWIELLFPEDREFELEAHDRQTASGEPWSREYRLIASDGRVVWVRDQATLVLDTLGGPTWQGVLVDVTPQHETAEMLQLMNEDLDRRVRERTLELEETNELLELEVFERRRAEKELRATEARYRQLVEHAPALVYAWQMIPGPEDTFVGYVSPQIEQLLGYTPEEWHSEWHVWEGRLHPHDRDRIVTAANRCAETGEPFEEEYRYLAKDGGVVWVFDRAHLLERDLEGRPFLYQGVMVDITAQKDAERRAAEAEARFRHVAEEGPFIAYAFTIDPDDPSRLTADFVSPRMTALLGYAVEDWYRDPLAWLEVVHPDDRDRVARQLAAMHRGLPWSYEYRLITSDGDVVWVVDRGLCTERDDRGRPSRFVGTMVESTSEVQERAASTEELSTLRAAVEGSPAIHWIEAVDLGSDTSRYLYVSPQIRDVLGFEPEILTDPQRHYTWLIHPEDRARITAAEATATRGGTTWCERYRVLHADGSYRWIRSEGRLVSGAGADPQIWVGLAIDVTGDMDPDGVALAERASER